MLERTRRALLSLAALCAAACVGAKVPYQAPAPPGPAAVDAEAAARLLVLVATEADPRINPPWQEQLEQAARAVVAALSEAHFPTTRDPRAPAAVRVTVALPIRGPDFSIRIDAKGAFVDRFEAEGRGWGPGELAELGRAVRQRVERSEAIAAIAAMGAPGRPDAGATGRAWLRAATASEARRRIAVLEFRGAGSPPILALLADRARVAAVEAARPAGIAVMTREDLMRVLKEQGRPLAACASGECEVETGRAVGADLVVTGEVSSVGEARLLVMRLVETASGRLLASRQAQGDDELALVDAARPAAAALFE